MNQNIRQEFNSSSDEEEFQGYINTFSGFKNIDSSKKSFHESYQDSKKQLSSQSNAKNSMFESVISYHQEHSIHKQYLRSPNDASQSGESYLLNLQQASNLNDFSKSIDNKKEDKDYFYKDEKNQLMGYNEMQYMLKNYNPVQFPQEEILLLKHAMQEVDSENINGKQYLDLVYEQYLKLNGQMDRETVQKKIVCDTLYLIRKQNLKNAKYYKPQSTLS